MKEEYADLHRLSGMNSCINVIGDISKERNSLSNIRNAYVMLYIVLLSRSVKFMPQVFHVFHALCYY